MERNWLVVTGYFSNIIVVSEHVTKAQAEKAVNKYKEEAADSLVFSDKSYDILTRGEYYALLDAKDFFGERIS